MARSDLFARLLAMVAAAATTAFVGCSSSSDGGSCVNIGGTWTYVSHCNGGYAGKTTTVTQSACNFSSTDPVTGATANGTVGGSNISISVSGTVCTGTVSGNTMNLVCGGNCTVSLAR
jgi:hypothetical protein